MKRHTKYAITATVLGLLLVLVPYAVVYSITGHDMWGTIPTQGTIAYPNFYDDFDTQVLNSTWKFVDPLGGSSIDPGTRAGWLNMTTTSPPSRDWINEPRLMQSNITGDFSIRTKVQATVNDSGMGAGLLIWKDAQNFLGLQIARGEGNQNQIIFGTDGKYLIYPLASSISPIVLSLVRNGTHCTGYYWNANTRAREIGTVPFLVDDPLWSTQALDVGLGITLAPDGNFSALFDYFSITLFA
jgi:hypothetical protein